MQVDLAGEVAVVTGAGRGIGRAIALGLAAAGAAVAAWDSRDGSAADVAKTITAAGGSATGLTLDVTDRAAMAAAIDEVGSALGEPSIVVNNAAVFEAAPFLELDEASWDRVLAVNLSAPFHLSQLVARRWVERGGPGTIVNVGSVSSWVAQANQAHYGASKGGLEMLTKNLALELAPYSIRVNAIAPGGPILSEHVRPHAERPGFGEAVARRNPMGRAGEPEEVVGAVLFLVSTHARYITGTTVVVDGGLTLAR